MKFVKTFLLVLITTVLAISKTGYAASSDFNSLSSDQVLENTSNSNDSDGKLSFRSSHQPIDNHLIEIDLQEDEEEDSDEKKRLAQLLTCTVGFEAISDFAAHSLGCTCKIKGIAQTQSIRLHLIIEKFQI